MSRVKSDKSLLNQELSALIASWEKVGEIVSRHKEVMIYDDENKWAENANLLYELFDGRIRTGVKKLRKVADKLPKKKSV